MPVQERYEIRETLGRGGMGVVYKAWDRVVRREVALKTIRDAPSRHSLALFQKECALLAQISHPNIVEIFDIGELEDEGISKPYFVMPLLPGKTLEELIESRSPRLTPESVVEIIAQACRGLQAAHEKGLIHRDIKPSNLFVLDDDSVKLIDFGVAQMADTRSTIGHKGTLLYMPPEQLEMKGVTPLSDLFSLALVCYEALTFRRVFERPTQAEIAQAILTWVPPSASEFNPRVDGALSRVVHKGMAKLPRHRFQSAREFAAALRKGLRNEPLDFLDVSLIQPRVERAARAFEQGDLGFASEILGELEAEGVLSTSVSSLRKEIDAGLRAEKISQLLASARTRSGEQEYLLALQKVEEALELDPGNREVLTLREEIEQAELAHKVARALQQAETHLAAAAFNHAREAIRNALRLEPENPRAQSLAAEIERAEQELLRSRQEKAQLYQAALEACQAGEIGPAHDRLERLMALEMRSPEPDREIRSRHESLSQQVRAEQEAIRASYTEARSLVAARKFGHALAICDTLLARYPTHSLIKGLKLEIEERGRQDLSERIAVISRQVETEPDLSRRVAILEEAVREHPGEPYFERALELVREKRDLVASVCARAEEFEQRGMYQEALAEWETIASLHPQYPDLSFEIARVTHMRDQQALQEMRRRTIDAIALCMELSDWNGALKLLPEANERFPGDEEIGRLESAARDGAERRAKSRELMDEGQRLCTSGLAEPGLARLREACRLDPANAPARAALLKRMVEHAREILTTDWVGAESLAREALSSDPAHDTARQVLNLARERARDDAIRKIIGETRQFEATGEVQAAVERLSQALDEYPGDEQLQQMYQRLTGRLSLRSGCRSPKSGSQQMYQRLTGRLSQVSRHADSPADTLQMQANQPSGPAALPPEAQIPPPQPAPIPVAPSGRPPAGRKRLYIIGGVAAAAAVAAFLGLRVLRGSGAGAGVPVEIRTDPPGAAIRIGDEVRGTSNLKLHLAAGTYAVEALLDGFHPATSPLTVRAGQSMSVEIPLTPMAQTLQVFTDVEDLAAGLDGQSPAAPPLGQLLFGNLTPGRHALRLVWKSGEAVVRFESNPGALSAVGPLEPLAGIDIVAIASRGGSWRVRCSFPPATLLVNGRPAGTVEAAGIEGTQLPAGNHEFVITRPEGEHKLPVQTSASPTLAVFVRKAKPLP